MSSLSQIFDKSNLSLAISLTDPPLHGIKFRPHRNAEDPLPNLLESAIKMTRELPSFHARLVRHRQQTAFGRAINLSEWIHEIPNDKKLLSAAVTLQ
jgi:hypothetical protein